MNSLRRTAWVAGLVLCLSLSVALAQQVEPGQPYSLIFGTVYGPDERPAPYVKIKVRRGDQKKAKWELVSDRRGEFAQRFPAGAADYFISTQVEKKYGVENKEVKVHIDNDERQDVALHLTKIDTKADTKAPEANKVPDKKQ